jgi:hypothetical protein
MKKPNKYNYLRVIQQNFGHGWEDVSQYLSDSYFITTEKHTDGKSLLKHDLGEYKLMGYPTRVINRKEFKYTPEL